jgi:hypothetical protein
MWARKKSLRGGGSTDAGDGAAQSRNDFQLAVARHGGEWMRRTSTCLALVAAICCAQAAHGQSLFDGSLLAPHASQATGLPPYPPSSVDSNGDFKSEFAPVAVSRRANGALIAAQLSPVTFHQEAVIKTTSLASDAYPARREAKPKWQLMPALLRSSQDRATSDAADVIRPALQSRSPKRGGGLRAWPATCDDCPTHGVMSFVSYDSFRGISDGSWQNNGIVVGLNYGTRLGVVSDLTGFGFQIGGSVGAFNWAGTDYRFKDQNRAQTQGFLTYGFFRNATESSRWSAAVVQDWMFNDNFGLYAQNPTLSQGRGQLGYATSAANEFGVWGTWGWVTDARYVAGVGPVTWRPINQLNGYWHHKWTRGGADTTIWAGVPQRHRLDGGGSLGDYLAGALGSVPLNDRFGFYGLVTYMHQSAHAGPAASLEDAWNFTVGVTLFPGRNARSNSVAGRCWMARLPVANNGYFLNDTNRTY